MEGWKQAGGEIGLILLKVFFLVVVIGVAWFVYDIAKELNDAFFMSFESEPKEGWAYWHHKRLWECLRGWAILILITLGVVGMLIWSISRSFVRLMKIP